MIHHIFVEKIYESTRGAFDETVSVRGKGKNKEIDVWVESDQNNWIKSIEITFLRFVISHRDTRHGFGSIAVFVHSSSRPTMIDWSLASIMQQHN